jgi:hypothetical protein
LKTEKERIMQVTSSHQKNPAVGWDITASAKADQGETIARAQIIVDDFPEFDQSFDQQLAKATHAAGAVSGRQYGPSDRHQ